MAKINRSLAIVIGIDEYTHIPKLKSAVNDAKKLADVLEDIHHYKVLSLLDQKATKENLDELLTNLKNKTIQFDSQAIQVEPSDRVLFYFAGHGFAEKPQDSEDGTPSGYFMPQNAEDGNQNTWLSMQEVYKVFTELDCHHLLMILDCCFAGSIYWAGDGRNAARSDNKLYQQHYDHFTKNKTQQIITSAAHDEEAQDSFRYGQRGEKNGHSPFAHFLLKILQGNSDGGKDKSIEGIIDDKVITVHELFAYLQNQLGKVAEGQTPALSKPRKYDQETGKYVFLKGEYVFLLNNFKYQDLIPLKLDKSTNPYKGLASFEKKDIQLFFGRKRLIEDPKGGLGLKVSNHLLTVVLGTSGSGKSSLVKAGLIPALESGQQKWVILDPMRPGESPLSALNKILTQLGSASSTILSLSYQEKRQIIYNKIENFISPDSKLLLVIDQTEELLTLCQNQEERADFINLLDQLLTTYQQQLRIVLTLRSEFEPQIRDAIKETHWQKVWQDGRFIVTPMDREELQLAIEEPAAQRALFFESPKLVNDLINEVAQMPGALPLLSFTLSELYLKYLKAEEKLERNDRTITEADYQEIGGVTRSLTQTADETYNKLVEEEVDEQTKKACELTIRDVILRMVAISAGELARRRVLTSELEYPGLKNKQAKKVIARFIEARLLVKGLEAEGQEYVEPVHDALIIGWAKIKYWLDEKQEIVKQVSGWNPIKNLLTASLGKVSLPLTSKEKGSKSDRPEAEKQLKVNLPLQREVNTSANNWCSKKDIDGRAKAVGFLWNADPRLPQLEQIQQSDDNWFNQTEAQFVERSIIQKRRNIRRIWIGVSVAFLTLSSFTLGIFIQLQQTELREKASRVRNLNQPLDKLILAIQATGQSQSILKPFLKSAFGEVQASLAEAIELSRESNSIPLEKLVDAAAISDDGKYIAIATSNPDGRNAILSLRNFSGDEINNFKVINKVYSMIFSPDNKTILIKYKNGEQLQLLDFKEKLIQNFSVSVQQATFSPQGNMIVTNLKKRVQLWDLKGNLIVDFPVSKEDVTFYSVAISPQGNMIIVSFTENIKRSDYKFDIIQKVQLWDLRGNLIRNFPVPNGSVYSVAFSHDGQRVVGLIDEPYKSSSTVRLWDIKGNKLSDFPNSTEAISVNGFTNKDVTSGIMSADSSNIRNYSVTFTTDGQKIISLGKDINKAGANSGLRLGLWNIKGDSLQQLLFKEADLLSFSRDGKYAITAENNISGNDYNVKLWDLRGNAIAAFSGSQAHVNAVAISPDGKTIASGSGDGSVRLWDSKGNFISQINPSGSKKGLFADTTAISISSNGQTLVSGTNYSPADNSYSGTVHLWNLQGTPTGTFKAYKDRINAIAISADGNTIVTSGSNQSWPDFEIRLWDRLGKLITENFQSLDETDKKRFNDGRKVAISLDGQTIVGTKNASTLQLWDRQGKTISKPLQGHTDNINEIAISSDGKTIVSASDDGTVRLWDRQGNPIGQPFQNPNPRSVAISNDGEYIVTGGGDSKVRLWDRQGNLIGQPMTGHPYLVSAVAISPDKNYIVSSEENNSGTLRLWRAGTWQTWLQIGCNRLRYHPSLKTPTTEVAKGAKETCEKYVWNLPEQPGQNGEITTSKTTPVPTPKSPDQKAEVTPLDLKAAKEISELKGHQGSVRSVAFSPDGQTLATSGEDGTIRLWNAQGKFLSQFKGNQTAIRSIDFSPDGQKLVSDAGGKIRLWDLQGNLLKEFDGQQKLIRSVKFSPTKPQLASTGDDGFIHLWDLDGKFLGKWQADPKRVWDLEFSPDGQQMASAEASGIVSLWNWQGKPLYKFKEHIPYPVLSVAFSPDGKQLVSGCNVGMIRSWSLPDYQMKNMFQVNQAELNSVAYSLDGKLIVTGDNKGDIKMWKVNNQQPSPVWTAHQNSIIRKVAFSPDVQHFATAADDGIVKLWQLE